ncbi:hypothetical protein DW682_02390 [Collinsella intestinalis]|uniref:Uncharacterized protein n=1 Tax=Collinsella intestinalis TaxID=147207 RepID=A0A414NFI1_9ACTN|nr:hypothetical protein DW682_02390 [Collinsella intestinalis]
MMRDLGASRALLTSCLLRVARALRAGCVSVAITGVHVGLLRTMGVMASSVTRKRSENRSVFCKSSYEIVTQPVGVTAPTQCDPT